MNYIIFIICHLPVFHSVSTAKWFDILILVDFGELLITLLMATLRIKDVDGPP